MSKPWRTKEWRAKRAKLIEGKTCEWCGSDIDLTIHHNYRMPTAWEVRKVVTQEILESCLSNNEFETVKMAVYTCPKCETHRKSDIKERKRSKPQHKHLMRFRCANCGYEFDDPATREIDTGRISHTDWDAFYKKYKSNVEQRFEEVRKELYDYYMSFEDTQILCKKCHYYAERGRKLCSVCGVGYHKPTFEMCFDCFKKTEKGKNYLKRKEAWDEELRLLSDEEDFPD